MKAAESIAADLGCNCQAIRRAARQVAQLYDRHLAAVDLRVSQYGILINLHRNGPQSIRQLAEHLVMDRTTLGRGIRPLERDGLIEIGEGANGRTKSLKLTAAGRKRVAEGLPHWGAAQKEFETVFGATESAALRETLDHLVSVIPRDP